MTYYVRLFTTSLLGSLVPLQAQMIQQGYHVKPVGTNQLDIVYRSDRHPLTADLTDSNNQTTRDDIAHFLDQVSRLTDEPDQDLVLDVLARTRSLIAVGVPDDYESDDEALSDVLDIVANFSEGLFQVDGEGFYDGGRLILRLA